MAVLLTSGRPAEWAKALPNAAEGSRPPRYIKLSLVAHGAMIAVVPREHSSALVPAPARELWELLVYLIKFTTSPILSPTGPEHALPLTQCMLHA